MTKLAQLSGIRVRAQNPNHHLWINNGTWFLHYTLYPTAFTRQRIRRSLGTKDINAARSRRDRFFAQLLARPGRKQIAA